MDWKVKRWNGILENLAGGNGNTFINNENAVKVAAINF